MTSPKKCIACGTVLDVGVNWYPSFKAKNHYKCGPCYDQRRLFNKIKREGPSANLVARLLERRNSIEFNRIKKGFVYVIHNPAWPEWYKVGSSINARNRNRSYQTSSPFRDFKLVTYKCFDERLKAERAIHSKLEALGLERRSEWFKDNNPRTIITEVQCHN